MSESPRLVVVMIMMVVTAIVVLTGVIVMDAMTSEEWKDGYCSAKFDDNATWVNDSDDTFDCRLSNGTVVEDVPVELHG